MKVPAQVNTESTSQGMSPSQNIQATPDAFGAQVAQAGERLGNTVLQTAGHFQDINNENAVNDAYGGEFSNKFRDLYKEYYALQGKDAVERQPEFQQKMEDLRVETRDNLSNSAQQRLFDQMARRRTEMELDGMARYADGQNKIWQKQSSDAVLNTSLNDAADKWNDEHAFGTAVGSGLAEIDRYAVRTGEPAKERADKFVSAAWTQRIEMAISHDPLAAKQLFEANQKEIEANVRPGLAEKVKKAAMPVEAKNDAWSIMGKDAVADTLTATQIRAHLADWMKQAQDVAEEKHPDDPIYRDLVTSQISAYTNRVATAEASLERNARNTVLSAVITPDKNGQHPSDLNALLQQPGMREAWLKMEPEAQLATLHILKQESDPPETVGALNKYHQLRGLAANDPAAFQKAMQEDFKSIANELPHARMLELIHIDTAVDKGQAKMLSQGLHVTRIHEATDGLLRQAGLDIPTKSDQRKDVINAYQNFTGRMLEATQNYIATNKKLPSDKDMQDMAKQLLVSGYQSGTGHTWFGHTWGQKPLRAFEADPNNKLAIPAPASETPKLREAYRKVFNREPTQDQINEWYANSLQQGKK